MSRRHLHTFRLLLPILAAGLTACGDDSAPSDNNNNALICTDECDTIHGSRCTGDWTQECLLSAEGCLAWTDTVDCAVDNLRCDDSTGFAVCSVWCTDDCAAEGQMRCTGATQRQICAYNARGCLDWEDYDDCADQDRACSVIGNDVLCVVRCGLSAPLEPTDPVPTDSATDLDPGLLTTLDWADEPSAVQYEVWMWRDESCWPFGVASELHEIVTDSEVTGFTVHDNQRYCWRVAVTDGDGCTTTGPVWSFHTGCNSVSPVAPTVTSGDATYPASTVSDVYTLWFSEPVIDATQSVTWTPLVGSGTLDAVVPTYPPIYEVYFSGVAPGDVYTLSVGTGIEDLCGLPLAATVDITLTVAN